MAHDANRGFNLLPDECNLIRWTLRDEWTRQCIRMEIIMDNLHREYNNQLQRRSLDSYASFKRCLKDLSCIADTLRKFGIDSKLGADQSPYFMRIYADVIHTVTGWNDHKLTLADCLNITSFTQEEYVIWKDENIRTWAFIHGVDPDTEVTMQHLIDDY